MWKRIKFYSVSAIIVALSATAIYLYLSGRRESVIRRVVDPPALVREIQRLNELVTVKYRIQKVIGLKEEKVPFGSESLLLMVQATALGGVDLSVLTPEDFRLSVEKSLTVRLPPPRVMHVFVDDKETHVWDRKKTWWTPWIPFNPELEQKARLAALEAAQATAIRMGILNDAQQNAENTIREFLRRAGFDLVTFEPAPTRTAAAN